MKKSIDIVLLFSLLAPVLVRGDPPKASTCVACHGQHGISANEQWPNLAGQKREYLVEQLEAFRQGERKNPLMTPVSQMLSDQDIRELAAYFSALKGGE